MFRFTAFKKYLYYLIHFATIKKLQNIIVSRNAVKRRTVRTSGYPYKITFDPGNICNLRCPGCHTGIKHPEMIKPAFMKFVDFKKMFDKVKDYTLSIALYNWGEPFLNKEIFKMISYAGENKVGTTLHSNFNHFNAEMADHVVRSGLTHLYLSIDGSTQEVYSGYRVKGNLSKVTEHIRILVDAKRKLNSRLPFITWKYLVFSHNEHEVNDARKIARSLGVNNFEVFKANPTVMDIYEEKEIYKRNPEALANLSGVCKSLWSSAYIQPDGSLMPCSLAFRKNESFGNLLQDDLQSIWNNDTYVTARSMFTTENVKAVLPCAGCKYSLICKKDH